MKHLTALFFLLSSFSLAATQPLSFDDAIEKILNRSPEIGIQENKVKSTNALNLPSRLSLLPSLSVSATNDFDKAFLSNETTTTRTLQGSMRFNLLRYGADFAAMNAAGSEEDAEIQTLSQTILSTENQAVKGLVRVLETLKLVQINEKILDTRNLLLKISKERYKSGRTPKQEVDKVSIDLENTTSSLRDSESNEIKARAELVNLLGDDNVLTDWPWIERFKTKAPPVLATTLDQLKTHPQWKAAKSRITSAQYRKNENFGNIFGAIDLTGSYGYLHSVTSGLDGTFWRGGVEATIPLFDRLSNYGKYKAQVHEVSSAELSFERVKRDLRSQFEANKGAFKISLETAVARDKILTMARKIYEDSLERYKRGIADANDLILDQQRLFDSETFAVRGWAEAHRTYTDYCHSLGLRVKNCTKTGAKSPPSKPPQS